MHRQPRRYARRPVEPIVIQTGEEVGRSCCVIEHRGKKIVCDAGLHPSYPGLGALPFIDELDWSTVDAILVTQYVDRIMP
jgi:cleavage and polyadenylation specificity factor subunit 3